MAAAAGRRSFRRRTGMNGAVSTSSGATILAVDDTPANLQLLGTLLRQFGFSMRAATSGILALRAARLSPPDLILLDVRMPKMDGYEVCRQLKADDRLKSIPVIFVSAHGETEEKLRAFQAGGVDYVTKPFQAEEVRARIGAQLEIHRLQEEVTRQNARLEEMVRLRTRQLEAANAKLAVLDRTKSDFLTVISQELRTPLNGLLGAAELAFDMSVRHPEMAAYRQMFEGSRQCIMQLVEDALLLSQMQADATLLARDACSVDVVIKAARSAAAAQSVTVKSLPAGLGEVTGDRQFLTEAITRLLTTAGKLSPAGQPLTLDGHTTPEEVCLNIRAEGCSIPDDVLPRFFEVLTISKAFVPDGSLGLSPAVASQIIRLMGGRVEITNLNPTGIQLQTCLPRRPAVSPAKAG